MKEQQKELVLQNDSDLKLEDLVASEQIFDELSEIIDYLHNKHAYQKIGAQMPKGYLFVGPPGTGKTYTAKVLASESKYNFIALSGSDFSSKFMGEAAKRISKLFKFARENSPCIIFIDEIDSIAGKRNNLLMSDGSLNKLLSEMDGYEENKDIIVIGSTNIKNTIDSAMLRPGRFDKIISFELPDNIQRKKLLEYYLKKIKHDKIDTESLSKLTMNYSQAEIKNLINTAAFQAVNRGCKKIYQKDIQLAFEKLKFGIKGNNSNYGMEKKDIEKIANYQIGKVLMILSQKGLNKVHQVSILQYGDRQGNILFIPLLEEYEKNIFYYLSQIDIHLAGKVAEEIYSGNEQQSTNCEKDLRIANEVARDLITKKGYSEFIIQKPKEISEFSKYEIDIKILTCQRIVIKK